MLLDCLEVRFSLLEIILLLNFDFILEYEAQMNLRYIMICRTISSVLKLPEVKGKHCGLLPAT